ncbi:BTAD domain-containing putative transcriptional regulator [Micromonospora sp. WMMD1102]|uniref:BTAD domain-containing putative transcriptional regulator n=1 Tax=Micromonospora sp. WMMD1102 TaxID=3016105 RepID=UPI002414F3B9|nr:BTAD domain-containing putative transcriptional regulator [Micromonospora sp. WMMD1102]MDG4789093.1 BTAD domain-containing putative transcriptional regulator [Micromonospora sp. WMMD1102]
MSEESETFGELLRGHRAAAGLTQAALAARAGVGVRTVRDLEHDRVSTPQQRVVSRLSAALGLSGTEQARLHSRTAGRRSGRSQRLRVDVLGPLRIRRGDQPVDVGPAKQRLLLALLAIQPDQAVPIPEIVDVLWEDRPPRSAPGLVHTYLTRLRRRVGVDGGAPVRGAGPVDPRPVSPVVVRDRHGYRLALPPDQVDAARFRTLAERAARARDRGEPHRAAELFAAGLACWGGPLLAGGTGLLRHPAAAGLARLRLDCVLALADLAFQTGTAARVTTPLAQVAEVEPLHERLHARLMLALACTGQQARALRLFTEVRDRLADELGVAPGAELRAAYLRVLRQQLPGQELEMMYAFGDELPQLTAQLPTWTGP